jgi:uncharacterized protein YjgD (DUF1641 family)
VSALDTSPRAAGGTDPGSSAPIPDDRLSRIETQLGWLVADARRRDAELEPLRDLAAEVGVLSGPLMTAVTDRVATLDERGYLRFIRSSAGVVERVVESFDEDDVTALGDNIVLILETLKGLTQPEIMHLLQRTASTAQQQAHAPISGSPPSTLALVRQLRDPEVRRGLARMIELLRSVGSEPTTS